MERIRELCLGSVCLLWLGVLGGCFSITIPEGKPCSAIGECPTGFVCGSNKKCYRQDAATTADGAQSDGAPSADGVTTSDGPVEAVADGPTDSATADDGASDCPAAVACTPANPCHVGQSSCDQTVPGCIDTQQSQADGTPCGDGSVCHSGSCVACLDGTTCDVVGQSCSAGRISCSTGLAVCVQSGNAPEGKLCGDNMVCSMGNCTTCNSGLTCTPMSPCHGGKIDCGSGNPVCVDQQNSIADGTSCGADMVCGGGACAACKAGQSCTVANPCKTGAIACDTGKPLCMEAGNVGAGTNCGAGKVCGDGTCRDCSAGANCTPTNPCHAGMISCSQGSATCTDSGTALANGVSCGTDMVCSVGSCVSCASGKACTPSGTMCKTGTTTCASGASVCQPTGNAGDGTKCDSNMVCRGGTCIDPITVVSPTAGCGMAPTGTGEQTIQTMGTKPANCADSVCGAWSYTRQYNVVLPQGYVNSKAYPLVFEGPGCGGNQDAVYPLTINGMNNAGNTVIRVGLDPPPNMIGHATNPNQGCFDDKEGDSSVDWVFYENLWDKLATQLCFDQNRVFAAGNSSGAWFSNEVGCKYAGDAKHPIRGIMPNTGGLPSQPMYEPTCTNNPLSGMWMGDLSDPENPFSNNIFAIQRAMKVNGCTTTTYDATMTDPFPIGGGNAADQCKQVRGCPALYPIMVCTVNNGTHDSHETMAEPGFSTFLQLFQNAPFLTP